MVVNGRQWLSMVVHCQSFVPGDGKGLHTKPSNGTVALQPTKAGAAVIRDLRVWHSGTPNLGKSTRFLPNVEICSAGYARYIDDPQHSLSMSTPCSTCRNSKCAVPAKELAKMLPEHLYARLSRRAKQYCERIVRRDGTAVPCGIRPNFAKLQETWKKGSGKGGGQNTQSGLSGLQRSPGPLTSTKAAEYRAKGQ